MQQIELRSYINPNEFLAGIIPRLDIDNMAEDSIKLLLFYQKYYPVIGIHPPQSSQVNRSPFNRKNWLFLLCLGQFFVSIGAFILFKVKDVLDFGPAFYIFDADVGGTIFYLIPIWQMGNTKRFIGNCEQFIKNRKHRKQI